MKFKIFGLTVLFTLFLAIPIHSFAQDAAVIGFSSLDETITVQADNTLAIKDILNYDFGSSGQASVKRDIAVKYSNTAEADSFKITNVKAVDSQGKPVMFNSGRVDFYQVISLKSASVFTGKQTFVLTYNVGKAYYASSGENKSLYWNVDMPAGDADKNIKVKVVFPDTVKSSQIQTDCSVTRDSGKGIPCDSASVEGSVANYTQAEVPSGQGFYVFAQINPLNADSGQLSLTAQTGESVQNFDSVLKINLNGSVNVKELITYNFGSNQKHGIYRNIPVHFKTDLGNLSTKISEVSVTDENNQPYKFTPYGSGDDFVIKIGDANATVNGIKTYVINYTISRVINFFKDHDELYWNVTGNGWEVPIEKTSAEVTVPGQTLSKDIQVKCYAGPFGSTNACLSATAKDNGANFSNGNLSANDGLTIVVGFPKGLVIPLTTWQKFQQIASDNWIVVVPFFALILMFLLWRYKGRDPEINDPIIAQYEAPGGLTPAEALELLKFSEPSRGITAEMIQLAVNGYLKINKKDKDYELIKLKPSTGLSKNFDQILLDGLFTGAAATDNPYQKFTHEIANQLLGDTDPKPQDKNSVLLSDLEDNFYTVLSLVKTQIKKSLISLNFFAKDPDLARLPYVAAAVLIGFFGFFLGAAFLGFIGFLSLEVTALIILLFGLAMPKRTLTGAQMAKQVLGLKLYLNVAEKDRLEFHNAPEKTPERFEKLLPYAIALGVETEWAKQFEGIYNTPPSWYNDNYRAFSTVALVSSLNHFHSVSSGTLSSRPGSSSGSSGFSGGSSGGGFGGGGGGSW